MAARRKISIDAGLAAVAATREALAAGHTPARGEIATATRFLLEELAILAPGGAVEVRVPPYGAVQCIGGMQHRRGTPPNVIETDALTWFALATGSQTWESALAAGAVQASGTRAELAQLLPILRGGSQTAVE